MRGGALRQIAQVQQRVETDQDAETIVSYKTVATLRVGVTTNGGREFWEARKRQPKLTHQVECRYNTVVQPNMRLVVGALVLQIESVYDPEQRRERLLLMCEEVVQHV